MPNLTTNPAAHLALAWFYDGNDKVAKSRLELFSKYLLMESARQSTRSKRKCCACLAMKVQPTNTLIFNNLDMILDNIADGIGATNEIETVFWICEHPAANPDHRVSKIPGKSAFEAMYQLI